MPERRKPSEFSFRLAFPAREPQGEREMLPPQKSGMDRFFDTMKAPDRLIRGFGLVKLSLHGDV